MRKAYFFSILLASIIIFSAFSTSGVFACTYHAYQQCSGSYLYWYDSCGNQQDSQYCSNGCYNNSCQGYNNNNNNYSYNNCAYHAYKLCVGNNIYWYDSCERQQDFLQSCAGVNMVCKYGQCVYQQPYVPPVNPYVAHLKTACSAGNIYWYDSLGSKTELYKNCADENSCTIDACSAGKCSNDVKCDGSTCAVGSADYNNYCSNSNNNNQDTSMLLIAFFGKENLDSNQWQKAFQVNSNGQAYFMISVANNSALQIDNVSISANIPSEISSLGNLQVNGIAFSGDIVSGINVGSVAPGNAKLVTFEGKAQAISVQATKEAVASFNVSGAKQSDSLSINFNPTQATVAAVTSAQPTTGFMSFLKRWYLWILVGLVLIFLFVVVFRRLSNNA